MKVRNIRVTLNSFTFQRVPESDDRLHLGFSNLLDFTENIMLWDKLMLA